MSDIKWFFLNVSAFFSFLFPFYKCVLHMCLLIAALEWKHKPQKSCRYLFLEIPLVWSPCAGDFAYAFCHSNTVFFHGEDCTYSDIHICPHFYPFLRKKWLKKGSMWTYFNVRFKCVFFIRTPSTVAVWGRIRSKILMSIIYLTILTVTLNVNYYLQL